MEYQIGNTEYRVPSAVRRVPCAGGRTLSPGPESPSASQSVYAGHAAGPVSRVDTAQYRKRDIDNPHRLKSVGVLLVELHRPRTPKLKLAHPATMAYILLRIEYWA